jgi:hypothetical protein
MVHPAAAFAGTAIPFSAAKSIKHFCSMWFTAFADYKTSPTSRLFSLTVAYFLVLISWIFLSVFVF